MPKEYIERGAILDAIAEGHGKRNDTQEGTAIEIWGEIKKIPAADVVSRELFEQVKWERDIATAQLEEHGIAFGEKKTEVRRGEWVIDSKFHRIAGNDVVKEVFVKCTYCGRRYTAGYTCGDFVDERIFEHARKKYPYCHCGAKMDGERKDEGK